MERNGTPVSFERLGTIRKGLTKALISDVYIPPKNKPLPLKLKQFKHPTVVTFLHDKDKKGTSLEISSLDVPGLLGKIGNVFQAHNLVTHAAKITTTGERADDFFLITDASGTPLTEEKKEAFKKDLIDALDNDPSQPKQSEITC